MSSPTVVPARKTMEKYTGLSRSPVESVARAAAVNPSELLSRPGEEDFDTTDIFPWIANWLKTAGSTRFSFDPYPATGEQGHYDLSGLLAADGSIRIGLAGDWGTGTDVAFLAGAYPETSGQKVDRYMGEAAVPGASGHGRGRQAGAGDGNRQQPVPLGASVGTFSGSAPRHRCASYRKRACSRNCAGVPSPESLRVKLARDLATAVRSHWRRATTLDRLARAAGNTYSGTAPETEPPSYKLVVANGTTRFAPLPKDSFQCGCGHRSCGAYPEVNRRCPDRCCCCCCCICNWRCCISCSICCGVFTPG